MTLRSEGRGEGWDEGWGFRGALLPGRLLGGEDSKSYLEGGDLGVQALAWDVWASDITAPGSHSNSCVLEGDEVLTTGWNM